jgi:hypothetical protein
MYMYIARKGVKKKTHVVVAEREKMSRLSHQRHARRGKSARHIMYYERSSWTRISNTSSLSATRRRFHSGSECGKVLLFPVRGILGRSSGPGANCNGLVCGQVGLKMPSGSFFILHYFYYPLIIQLRYCTYPRIKQSVNPVGLEDGQIRDPSGSPMDLRPVLQPYTWSQPESARRELLRHGFIHASRAYCVQV